MTDWAAHRPPRGRRQETSKSCGCCRWDPANTRDPLFHADVPFHHPEVSRSKCGFLGHECGPVPSVPALEGRQEPGHWALLPERPRCLKQLPGEAASRAPRPPRVRLHSSPEDAGDQEWLPSDQGRRQGPFSAAAANSGQPQGPCPPPGGPLPRREPSHVTPPLCPRHGPRPHPPRVGNIFRPRRCPRGGSSSRG